jgi:uncharacterized protein
MPETRSPRTWLVAILLAALVVAGCSEGPEGGSPVAESSVDAGGDSTETATPTESDTVDEILSQIEDDQAQHAEAAAPKSAATGQQLEVVKQYLSAVVMDADKMWTQYLTSWGYGEQTFSYRIIMPGESVPSDCASQPTVSDYPNAFYCADDQLQAGYTGAIYLPAETFLKMWGGNILERQSKSGGDFAAAIVAVHEIGHEIVQELSDQSRVAQPSLDDKWSELLPDCFAGVWLANQYWNGGLSGNRYNEAVDALEAIGDDSPGGSDPHGSHAERREAIQIGYGQPGQQVTGPKGCIQTYWR